MTICELIKSYNFHDSLITNISFRESTHELILTIEFCFWAQDDYQQGEDDVGMVQLHFTGVSSYSSAGLDGDVDYFSILDALVDNGVLVINILDDFHDQIYSVRIIATSVSLEKLKV